MPTHVSGLEQQPALCRDRQQARLRRLFPRLVLDTRQAVPTPAGHRPGPAQSTWLQQLHLSQFRSQFSEASNSSRMVIIAAMLLPIVADIE
jgi:hypothetical protein